MPHARIALGHGCYARETNSQNYYIYIPCVCQANFLFLATLLYTRGRFCTICPKREHVLARARANYTRWVESVE